MESAQLNRTRQGRLIVAIAAFLVILFLLGWIPHALNQKNVQVLADDHPLSVVTVMQVHPHQQPIELVLPSSAQAWHITPIWARVNGYLKRYLVDIGDVVKEGDLLAEIETPDTDELVAQAKADLERSIADREIANITSDRWQRLWNKNAEAVSKQQVDQYHANAQAAEAIVLANQKNVAKLTYQQQFKYVYAPFDGTITQRKIDIGSLIYGDVNGIPQELFQLIQTSIIRFFVEVPQYDFRQIKEGVEAKIFVKEFPKHIFKGVVTRYAKALDPIARTLLTEVDVENGEGLLYAGVYARVKFLIFPETINFILPTTAILIRSGLPHIAVVDDHHIVHFKQVNIGRDYGKELEITFGLEDNDWVITTLTDNVQEFTKVDPIRSND